MHIVTDTPVVLAEEIVTNATVPTEDSQCIYTLRPALRSDLDQLAWIVTSPGSISAQDTLNWPVKRSRYDTMTRLNFEYLLKLIGDPNFKIILAVRESDPTQANFKFKVCRLFFHSE